MIRPVTCISVLLACGAGLYLYQTKHHAQVVDRQIEHTVQAITATRMQTRELAAAWTLLGNPDRLQVMANQYLEIKPVQPSQFVALSDLDSRLPPPRALPPAPAGAPDGDGAATPPIASAIPATPADGPGSSAPAAPAASLHAVAAAGGPAASTPSAAGAVQSGKASPAGAGTSPAPFVAAGSATGLPTGLATGIAKPPASMATHPTDRQPADAPHPPHEVAQTRPTSPHPANSSPVVAELDRPVTPTVQRLAPAPQTGSLLGMAHIALPAPVPISTAPFSNNGN